MEVPHFQRIIKRPGDLQFFPNICGYIFVIFRDLVKLFEKKDQIVFKDSKSHGIKVRRFIRFVLYIFEFRCLNIF